MLLSMETTVRVSDTEANIINHMGYSAYKLWNVCNYERRNYDASSGVPYPDWYVQKAGHKDDHWYKSLPSQSAQEICKQLDKAWKSYFALLKSGGIVNPRPPRFKHDPVPVTYMQNGMKRLSKNTVRFSIPKALKKHMSERYNIHDEYLYIKNQIFDNMDVIKQIKLYMPKDGVMRMIVVYEVPDREFLPDNGHYLSIDLGVHNFLTCVDSPGCSSFIVGRQYLSIMRYYDKEIARIQSRWAEQQVKRGVKHPGPSRHVLDLYTKKRHCVNDYLHKVTRYIADYCRDHHIHTVVIGDLTGVRKNKDLGDRINQELHALPYRKVTMLLKYKLALYGIRLIAISEAYSSKCSPQSPSVCKKYASGSNRIKRGLYMDNGVIWNADSVGAYNILRIYLEEQGVCIPLSPKGLSAPKIIKVAV